MTRIGVLGNCQAQGIASCLEVMVPGSSAFRIGLDEILTSDEDMKKNWLNDLHKCDLVFTIQIEGKQWGELATTKLLESIPRMIIYPNISFTGFHPDCGYLISKGAIINMPSFYYSSSIVAGAYLCGLPISRVVKLFNAYSYASLGYFDEFQASKNLLMQRCATLGYDLQPIFQSKTTFMHTINHPTINVLNELARQALLKAGLAPSVGETPIDLLEKVTIWPVYPEIADRIGGSQSSLLFDKRGEKVSIFDFVESSYNSYSAMEADFTTPAVARAETFIKSNIH